MEALKLSFYLGLGCPSIGCISASKKNIWFSKAETMSSSFSIPHSTYNDAYYLEKLHKYLKICWCQILILHWMLELSAKNLDLNFVINGGKKINVAFVILRRLDVSTTFAQNMSYQFQIGHSVSKILWPVPRKDIQDLSQVTLAGKRVCSQPMPAPKVLHVLCWQPDVTVPNCNGLH